MKKLQLSVLILPLIGVVFFSCAGTPPLEKMVPRESLFYFQIAHPDQLLEDTDLFLRSLQLQSGDVKLKDQLMGMMAMVNSELSAEVLDFSRPIGFAGVPVTGETKPGFMLLIPLAEGVEAGPLKASFDKQQNAYTLEHKGYLIVFSREELKDSFPPKKSADLGHLRDYSSGALHAYINMGQFFNLLDLDMESLKTALEETDTGSPEIAGKILEGYLNIFRQMDTAWAALAVGDTGLEVKGDLFFRDDMARFMKSVKPVSGTGSFPITLEDEDYFFSALYNIDLRDREALTDKFYSFLLSLENEPDPSLMEYLELSRAMNRTMGPRGIFAMDMTIYPEAVVLENPAGMMDLQMTGAMELIEPDAFESALEKLYAHPGMDGLFAALYGEESKGWKIALEKKRYGNITYREMSYQVPEQPGLAEVAALMERMKIYYVIRDQLCYLYLSMGGEPVETFLEKAASGAFEADAGEQPDWVTRAPDSAHFIWNMRMTSFMDMVPLAQGSIASLMPPEPAGISGYTVAGQGLMSSTFIPSGEILWLIQSFAMLRASLGQP